MSYSAIDIARSIDHSLLQPAMTDQELDAGCRAAAEWGVASVCVKPYFVPRAATSLAGSTVKTGTTVGFPHGGHIIAIKVAEAKAALGEGAEELDMVINIGKAKSGDWKYIEDEIGVLTEVAHEAGGLLKIIFENCYLTDDEKRRLCRISANVGADFIKTSTGFGAGGATDHDLQLMIEEAAGTIGVKAAGGIRTYEDVVRVMAMGVKRIGASQTEQILKAAAER